MGMSTHGGERRVCPTALQPPPHLLTTLPVPAGSGRCVCPPRPCRTCEPAQASGRATGRGATAPSANTGPPEACASAVRRRREGPWGPTWSLLASAVLLAHHQVELRGPGPVLLACRCLSSATQSTDFKWWTEIASAHGDVPSWSSPDMLRAGDGGASYSAVPWR